MTDSDNGSKIVVDISKGKIYVKHPKSYKKKKVSEKELRSFLFGWLWVEENITKEVRKKLAKPKKAIKKSVDVKQLIRDAELGLLDSLEEQIDKVFERTRNDEDVQ